MDSSLQLLLINAVYRCSVIPGKEPSPTKILRFGKHFEARGSGAVWYRVDSDIGDLHRSCYFHQQERSMKVCSQVCLESLVGTIIS